MVWAAVEVGDERVGVAAAHLDHKAEPLREKQLKRFLDELRVNGPALHLICGDLNTFCKSDHDAAAWAAILAFYDKRGWGAPAEASATLDAARPPPARQSSSGSDRAPSVDEGRQATHEALAMSTKWSSYARSTSREVWVPRRRPRLRGRGRGPDARGDVLDAQPALPHRPRVAERRPAAALRRARLSQDRLGRVGPLPCGRRSWD